MYTPPAFAERDAAVLLDHVAAHPLGILVTAAPLRATHLPLRLDRARGVLQGHVARANPHAAAPPGEALVIFPGPEAYVHPGWYPTKQEHGRVVPTWNYVAVHVHGPLRTIEDPAWLRAHLDALTAEHEAGRDHPWAVDDAPADYVAAQLRGIVGVEIAIARIEGKWKMSQNRSAADVAGVIAGLSASPDAGDRAAAEVVAARCPVRPG